MRIVVLAGGLCTERDVSISSGVLVADALRQKGHQVVLLDVYTGYEENFCDIDALFEHNYSFAESTGIGKTICDLNEVRESRLDKSDRFIGANVIEICCAADMTFLALHGGEGENGQIQATLDLFGIKYTGSGYLGSALAMNKGLTKSVLVQNKILTPEGEIFKNAAEAAQWNSFPCIVKPCSGGSSVGIAKVKTKEEYDKAVKDAFAYEDEIVVEKFVGGREFSVGILDGKALPPIEIVPKTTEFYDYVAKYQAEITDHICPCDISADLDSKMRKAAVDTYNALHLESYARVDFIADKNGNVYCLEANTLPGMTPTSLLPLEAAAEGLKYADLCEKIIEISIEKYKNKSENRIGYETFYS